MSKWSEKTVKVMIDKRGYIRAIKYREGSVTYVVGPLGTSLSVKERRVNPKAPREAEGRVTNELADAGYGGEL